MLCRQLLAAAKAVTGGNPDAQLQEEFLALTEDVDQLKQDAIRLRAEAEGIACTNPRVVGSLAAQQCSFLSAKRAMTVFFDLLGRSASSNTVLSSLHSTSQKQLLHAH